MDETGYTDEPNSIEKKKERYVYIFLIFSMFTLNILISYFYKDSIFL